MMDEKRFKPFIKKLLAKIDKAIEQEKKSIKMEIHASHLTSKHDIEHSAYLKEMIPKFKKKGITLTFNEYQYQDYPIAKYDMMAHANW